MKKVTAFVASARRKHTYAAVGRFLENLKTLGLGEIETELVPLSDYRIGTCRGCLLCFKKGEEFCPMKDDDRDPLFEKIMASDGVIFATPVYSFQVSALMKIFLDRMGFLFHRPRFHGKAFTCIAVEGLYGGADVVKYLEFVGGGLGFNVVKGSRILSLEQKLEAERRKRERTLDRHAARFYDQLMKPAFPSPNLIQLLAFRMGRTSIRRLLDEGSRDYAYYRDKGWFSSDYFYPTRLGPFKKLAGAFFDWWAMRKFKPAPNLTKI